MKCYFSRTRVPLQHPQVGLLSVMPDPWNPMHSFGLCRHQTCTWHTDICRQNTHVQKEKKRQEGGQLQQPTIIRGCSSSQHHLSVPDTLYGTKRGWGVHMSSLRWAQVAQHSCSQGTFFREKEVRGRMSLTRQCLVLPTSFYTEDRFSLHFKSYLSICVSVWPACTPWACWWLWRPRTCNPF